MRSTISWTFSAVLVSMIHAADPTPWGPSLTLFSSQFSQPEPPQISAEYKAHWKQHKWDNNVSHISAGFIYSSPSNGKVRVDETYDLGLGSSLFDYNNVTEDGVANQQWILSPSVVSPADCFVGFVNPAFPLISTNLLIESNAVFGGIIDDPSAGTVAAWHILFQGSIPAKILLDENNVVQGYDFWGTERRTYVVTRFFNIILGKIGAEIFDFPCSPGSPKLFVAERKK